MTRPVDIPNASNDNDLDSKALDIPLHRSLSARKPTAASAGSRATTGYSNSRNRSHTIASIRFDAEGNAYHFPPDSKPARSSGSASAASSSILSMLGLGSPTSSSSSVRSSSTSSTATPATAFTSTSASDVASPRGLECYSPSAASSDDPSEAATPPTLNLDLDESENKLNHKYQLHELDDVFDENGTLSGVPTGYAHHVRSASLGHSRRASWSPAPSKIQKEKVNPSPAPTIAQGDGATIASWLHGQRRTASPTFHSPSSPPDSASTDSSSPMGLFRRLSISANRRPTVIATPNTASEMSDPGRQDLRMGRPLTKVQTAPAPVRRVSPTGERMLRADYDSFS